MKLRAQFCVSGQKSKIQKMKARRMLIQFRQLLTIQENPSVDLVVFDVNSWCFLSETSNLTSNTAPFSFVVNVGGIETLDEEETSTFTLFPCLPTWHEMKHQRNVLLLKMTYC